MSVALVELDKCPGCNTEGVTLKEVYGVPVCEKCAPKCFSEKFRNQVQAAYERAVNNKRKEIWNKRVELVKNGVRYLKVKNYNEALRCYKEYVALLEAHHRVPQGGLSPRLFEKKEEAGDILLIAGIYWDMVKIYDLQGKIKIKELQLCLNKYVEFSVGRKHTVLSSETMRKYLASDECKNKDLIEGAYKVLQGSLSRCFIASAVYEDSSKELNVLRNFRDQTLMHSTWGRAFVRIYYKTSPKIAAFLVKQKTLSLLVKKFLDQLVKKIT